MNILIKGMEIPKSCYECKLDLRSDVCSAFCEWNAEHPYSIRATDRLPGCPLSEVPECEDAVSRKAVIDTIDEWNEACADSGHKETVSDIMLIRKDFIDLPPVTPEQFERIRGRWVKGYDGRHAVCSNCEAWWIPFGEGYKADYHFCPNCGAKMEGVAE